MTWENAHNILLSSEGIMLQKSSYYYSNLICTHIDLKKEQKDTH